MKNKIKNKKQKTNSAHSKGDTPQSLCHERVESIIDNALSDRDAKEREFTDLVLTQPTHYNKIHYNYTLQHATTAQQNNKLQRTQYNTTAKT